MIRVLSWDHCELEASNGGARSTVKRFRSEFRKKNLEAPPTMLAEQVLNHIPGFVELEIPTPWKIEHIPSPEEL